MSEHRPDAPDDNETVIRQEANDEKTQVRKKPVENTGQGGEATVLRKPVSSENATILREPAGDGSENATILRTPAPKNEHATILRSGDDDATVLRPGADDDSTVLNPALDDDSTIIGDRATASDTTYIASVGRQIESKGNSEAGRLLKNRFVLEEKVGSGGMGDVYKALDLRAQEAQERNPYIAIKLLNENFARHKNAFMSLQREAQKTRGIPHKNIMGVYDFDREGDTVYMTMELLTGKPLDDYLKEHPEGVSVEDAWNIIDGICQGLSRAHGAGIVHSDFKPGNIFYTADKVAKVFDFGIARAVKSPGDMQSDGEKTVFDAGSLGALTPTYASYEMLKGMEPSKADDVYAVALVAYELFTGKHPYDRVPADKALERGMKPAPVPFLKRRHWKALKKGLELRGEDRTQTIDEFHEGMFSEDPPILRYTAIAAVLLGSIGFGAYTYFFSGPAVVDPELQKLRLALQSNQTLIADRLKEPNWESPDWHAQLGQAINRLKLAGTDMLQNWSGELTPVELEGNEAEGIKSISEDLKARQGMILDTYLDKIENLRVAANALEKSDVESVRQSLRMLEEAAGYMVYLEREDDPADDIKKFNYQSFNPARVDAERKVLSFVLSERQKLLADYEERQRRLEAEAEARRLAEAERQRLIEEERQRNATYDQYVADLKEILRCKGNIPSTPEDANYRNPDVPGAPRVSGDELALLGKTLKAMERTYPARFDYDREPIVKAIAGCIARRIAAAKPVRARAVKARVMTYLPNEPLISNIQISDKDPCAARGLEGQGIRNRSWCSDKLSIDDQGPQLVVVPPMTPDGSRKFALSRTEIRIGEYNTYCEDAGCEKLSGSNSLPATNLSLEQINAYAAWLSEQSGRKYRLPTVEEWQYAARTSEETGVSANVNVNCTVDSRGVRLGEKLLNALSGRPNPWGLYNAVGNARELALGTDGKLWALGGAHTDPKSECTVSKKVEHTAQADPVTGFRLLREIGTWDMAATQSASIH